MATQIHHRSVQTNGINMHIAEAGSGPLVLLLHGFPEFWYSWRKQLPVIAEAGFHAVAPDLRGYGETDAPESPDKYTLLHQVGDVIGLLDALGEKKALLVAHDWGAYLAWHVALFRPDRVVGIAALSVPFFPRSPKADLVTAMRALLGDSFYMWRFQSTEYAEEAWEKMGYEKSFKSLLLGTFEKGYMVPDGEKLADVASGVPEGFLPYFTEEDLKMYVDTFTKTGMTGAFSYYRHIRLSWELTAPWAGAAFPAHLPAIFIAGSKDGVLKFPGVSELIKNFNYVVPGMKKVVILEGANHFIQWERSEEVNKELLEFLLPFKDVVETTKA
eukprot:TRINITY_DN17998_c0_g1_i1.p1 TRINITY_DN17998_c0_g1~~TRINITY_DN17998_c0_g1_i1.p1  ORF type:complete len:348 (+),score=81.57 TRINITY_DN17998_c0_g1_i1:59-1045(+)